MSESVNLGPADAGRSALGPAATAAASLPPSGGTPDPNQSGGRADGEVSIHTQSQSVSGWTEVEIRGGLDSMPASFDIGLTEHDPANLQDISLAKGDACTVMIGNDVVITGWINRVSRQAADGQHTIRVQGRSRCQDLVDCSSLFPGLSTNNASIGALARTLAAPFAGPITVLTPDGDGLARPEYFSVSLGETPWEIISQVAAYEGLLVHDDARGDLVICKVGATSFASGFVEGQNLQAFGVEDADDMLFSRYVPVYTAQDNLAQIGPGGNAAGSDVLDPLVTRYRPLVVISDQQGQGQTLAQQRATWEATRRRGRSKVISLTCDSWRDGAGTLWTHNVLAPVKLPSMGIPQANWIVASWVFRRNGEVGTVAEITLMPSEAFSVEPTALTDTNRAIAEASREAAIDARHTYTSDAIAASGQAPSSPNAGPIGSLPNGGYGL